MARATGCSASCSTAAASRSASSSVSPPAVRMPTTRCSPSVSVPVLSKTTVVSSRASSSPRRSRTSSPLRAPSVVEIAMTSGTASPSACGQAITSTVTSRSTANAALRPAASHPTKVSAPAPSATMVSQNAARSARAWARLRDCCACSTRRMIPASMVCSPSPVTSIRSDPASFTVPAIDAVTGFLFDRPGLARDHRLVHAAVALAHHAIGRYPRPRADQDQSPSRSGATGTSSTRSPAPRARSAQPCPAAAWPARRARPAPG